MARAQGARVLMALAFETTYGTPPASGFTGTIRSDGKDGIACWFIDTDYNEESFFVRHAYCSSPGMLGS